MSEMLCRGKRQDNGEWVQGYFVRLYDAKGAESHRIYSGFADTECGEFYPDWHEVDPKTVGQWTGLTDINDVKVFEGDVVKAGEETFVVKFGLCGGVKNTEHAVGYIGFCFEPSSENCWNRWIRDDIIYWHEEYGLEVIGNIHDNPELMAD